MPFTTKELKNQYQNEWMKKRKEKYLKDSNGCHFEDEYTKEFYHTKSLKSCPFCGRSAIYLKHKGYPKDEISQHQENAMKGLVYVGCPEPISRTHVCDVAPSASWFADLERAIIVWNSREKNKV